MCLVSSRRWSRREEGDFYRALISFGVEQELASGDFVWDRFKQIARLETKFDHTLTEYHNSFMAMCKRVCHKQLTKEEGGLFITIFLIFLCVIKKCLVSSRLRMYELLAGNFERRTSGKSFTTRRIYGANSSRTCESKIRRTYSLG